MKSESKILVENSDQLYQILKRVLKFEDEISRDREHLWVIGFKKLNYIEFIELVAYGSLESVKAVPREVYRMAVSKGCNRIVLAHNHPGGSLKPSIGDLEVSVQLLKAGQILGIKVLDHLIITNRGYRSGFIQDAKKQGTLPKDFDPLK